MAAHGISSRPPRKAERASDLGKRDMKTLRSQLSKKEPSNLLGESCRPTLMPITFWSGRCSYYPTSSNQILRHLTTSFLLHAHCEVAEFAFFGCSQQNSQYGWLPKAAAIPISHMHMVFLLLNYSRLEQLLVCLLLLHSRQKRWHAEFFEDQM